MGTKENTQQTLSLLLLFLLPLISSIHLSNSKYNDNDFIRKSCNATLYPDLCYTSLSPYANAVGQSPPQLACVAVSVSLSKAQCMVSYISKLSHQNNSGAEPRAVAALHDCFTTFDDAVDLIRRSLNEMRTRNSTVESFRFRMSNVQTWMSAALTNEDTCSDGFDGVSDGPIKSDVCNRASKVMKISSNALALVNSYVANETNATGTP